MIGVGITGWMNNPQILFNPEIQKKGAEEVKKWNKIVAELIGINQAARVTTVKPAGNSSVLLGCASGIHGEHSPLYLRHVQFNKDTEIAKMFMKENPNMCEDSVWAKDTDVVVAFPVVSPENSIYKKDLLGVKQLEYVKLAQQNWIEYGTNHELCVIPELRHNVSNTITVDDWDEVTDYIYENRKYLCGISLLSASGDKAYPQAPFTEVFTEQQIIDKYGQVAMFASGLIERGLKAFNNDLWNACATALGYGEKLTDTHKDVDKREFVLSFKKFAKHFVGTELTEEDWKHYDKCKQDVVEIETEIENIEDKIDSIETTIDALGDTIPSEDLNNIMPKFEDNLARFIDTLEVLKQDLIEANKQLQSTTVWKAKAQSHNTCSDCLKDVYNLHKWWKIQKTFHRFTWASELGKKEYVDINTMGAQACSGGACEVW